MARMSIDRMLQNPMVRAGLGTALFSICIGFLDVGLSMTGIVNPALGWAIAGFAIFGMLLGAFLVITGRSSVCRALLIHEKGSEIRQIPETLTLMHQQVRHTRYKLAKEKIESDVVERLREKALKLSPINDRMRRRLYQLIEAGEDIKFLRAVKFINKWKIGSIYGKRYETFICNIGGLLETENIGLNPALEKNKNYRELRDKLEMQCAGLPERINKPIFKYRRYLYGVSSVILLNDYRLKHSSRLPDLAEIGLSQFDTHGEVMILDKLRENVITAIDKYLR